MNTDALAKFNTIVHLKAKEMHILKKKSGAYLHGHVLLQVISLLRLRFQ